jgi:hypothetical protein
MPSQQIRRGSSIRRGRGSAEPGPTRAELEAVQLSVEDFRSRLEPVPGRLAQTAKAIDAQQKRLETLAQALERTRAALDATRTDLVALGQTAARGPLARAAEALRGLRARTRPATPPPVAADAPAAGQTAKPKITWVLAGGKVAPEARAVMVALFGLPPAEIEGVVAKLTAAAAADPGPLVRVYLTDSSAFDAFRARGLPFEYLPPPPAELHGPRRDWSVYQTRRFALLCDKWQPVEVVCFGPAATARLAAWQASPHLPDSVRQLLPLAPAGPGPAAERPTN